LFIHTLERQLGGAWINVPVDPLIKKEPKLCQDGAD